VIWEPSKVGRKYLREFELALRKILMLLITGAAGFIGSNMCHHMAGLGYSVLGIDALLTGSNMKNLEGCELTFEELDLRDVARVEELFDCYSIDHIVHLAAQTHVDRSLVNSEAFWSSNAIGTANLMETAAKRDVVRLVINQITDEVFGSRFTPADEDTMFRPGNPYAASKAAQYYAGQVMYYSHNLPVVSTFPTNTYGPRQWPEKLIPKFTMRLLDGQEVPFMKTNAMRDWLWIGDHCKALHLLLKYGKPGQSYLIPGDYLRHNSEVVEQLLFLTGQSADLVRTVPDRTNHDYQYMVSGEKMYDLGWHPQKDFYAGIKETVEWYQQYGRSYYPTEAWSD